MPKNPTLNPADLESTIFLAGQIVGLTMRLHADTYAAAAEQSQLDPKYKDALRLLAAFRRGLSEHGDL